MPSINKKQAYKPQKAKWIPNKLGTANGIIWKINSSKTIITFPGVPKEMYQMWKDIAKPYLRKYANLINHAAESKFPTCLVHVDKYEPKVEKLWIR